MVVDGFESACTSELISAVKDNGENGKLNF